MSVLLARRRGRNGSYSIGINQEKQGRTASSRLGRLVRLSLMSRCLRPWPDHPYRDFFFEIAQRVQVSFAQWFDVEDVWVNGSEAQKAFAERHLTASPDSLAAIDF